MFPQSFSLAKPKLRDAIQKRAEAEVDLSQGENGKPYTFKRDAPFTTIQLAQLDQMPEKLQAWYKQNILDEDMMEDLKKVCVLNWCKEATKLYALRVPADGNCLLHAVSVIMWGINDDHHLLRRLMVMAITNDYDNNFKKRWLRQRIADLQELHVEGKEIINQEWDEVIRKIRDSSAVPLTTGIPYKFLESIHVYVLANILRRPIIIATDATARSVMGHSLQENHMGGIYLPLQWRPIDCCKTPIILGFSYSHFCPLVGEFLNRNEATFPLVSKDFCSLPIRFLTEEEEKMAGDLIQSYFIVKELDIKGQDGESSKILCIQFSMKGMPQAMNIVEEHLKTCLDMMNRSSQVRTGNEATMNVLPTGVVSRQSELNMAGTSKGPRPNVELSPRTRQTFRPTPGELVGSRNVGLRPEAELTAAAGMRGQECISEGCFSSSAEGQGGMCSNCFKNYTITEAGKELVSVHEGNKKYYMLTNTGASSSPQPALFSEEDLQLLKELEVLSQPLLPRATDVEEITKARNVGLVPTAPLPSGFTSTEEPGSVTVTQCQQKGCKFRASKNTYPYCHECFPHVLVETGKSEERDAKLQQRLKEEVKLPPPSVTQLQVRDTNAAGSLALSETIETRNSDLDDIEVSEEPSMKDMNEGSAQSKSSDTPLSAKCISPFCDAYISPPEKLCKTCQDILKKHAPSTSAAPAHATKTPSTSTAPYTRIEDSQRDLERKLAMAPVKLPTDKNQTASPHYRTKSRGNPCLTSGCPNYGDPANADMCSSCYSKAKKAAAARSKDSGRKSTVASAPGQVPILSSSQPQKQEGRKAEGRSQVRNTTYQGNISFTESPLSTSIPASPLMSFELSHMPSTVPPGYVVKNLLSMETQAKPAVSHSVLATSMSRASGASGSNVPVQNIPHTNILPSGAQYQSGHVPGDAAFESKFRQQYEQFAGAEKRKLAKCRMKLCDSYGNPQKKGYCNACYPIYLKQKELEWIAIHGEDVPDGATNGVSPPLGGNEIKRNLSRDGMDEGEQLADGVDEGEQLADDVDKGELLSAA